jgi:hypothetical protein
LIKPSIKDRLLHKKRLTSSGCWEYTGERNRDGYGLITFKGKKQQTHRISAMIFKGYDLNSYNSGLQINHTCHNRICFNPEHLYIGTHEENMHDLVDKNKTKEQNNEGV